MHENIDEGGRRYGGIDRGGESGEGARLESCSSVGRSNLFSISPFSSMGLALRSSGSRRGVDICSANVQPTI